MSDNLYLNERVAPHSIRFSNMTPLAFSAQSTKRIYYTSNQSTYSQTNTVFRIPISSGTDFLDGPNSYLKFDYINRDADPVVHTMSNSASCLFYRVRIIADKGGDLENILYYGFNHACVADGVLDPAKRLTRKEQGYGSYGLALGGLPLVVAAATDATRLVAVAADAAANQVAIRAAFVEVNANLALLAAARNTSVVSSSHLGCDETRIAFGQTQTFCVPLDLSALLGPSQKRFLPLFLTGGLTLEITLDPNGPMTSGPTRPLFDIANVQYHAQCITFDNSVNSALTAMTQQSGLFMHATSWTNIMTTLGDTGSNNWMIQERLRSLKSAFFAFQNPAFVAANWRSTARASLRLTQFQLKIGSTYYPPQQIKVNAGDASLSASNGEFLVEYHKALGEYNNINHSSMINTTNFGTDYGADANRVCRAVYGLDLDSFGRSDVESGVNTIINNPITFNVQCAAIPGYTPNCYNMLLHDVVFSVDPSGAFTCNK